MSGHRGLDPASSKYGSVLLVLFGAIGVPLLASEGHVQAGAVFASFISVLLVVAGLFGFMSCLKKEAMAEMRGLIHQLQGQVTKLQATLEGRNGPAAATK